MKRTLAEYARSCGGELLGADRAYAGVAEIAFDGRHVRTDIGRRALAVETEER